MQPEIQHLIERWRDGDERAAEALYGTYRADMLRLAWSLVREKEGAEEVLQDAMTYALLHIDRYDSRKSAFKTWLFTITVSRSRDFLRRKRFRWENLAAWLEGDDEPRDHAPFPETQLVRMETQAELWQSLQALPARQREALILRYWGECTYQEMSEILDAPLATVQSRVRLGYQKLRSQFHQGWVEESEEQWV